MFILHFGWRGKDLEKLEGSRNGLDNGSPRRLTPPWGRDSRRRPGRAGLCAPFSPHAVLGRASGLRAAP